MKTPREVLLQRHQSAEGKLDLIRESVVSKTVSTVTGAKAGQGEGRRPSVTRIVLTAWQELIWPSRYAWGGMAAVWLALFGLNREFKAPSHHTIYLVWTSV